MKISVDRETCIGCGACASICGQVFELDKEGKAVVTSKFVGGGDLPACAQDAADSCPVSAIKIAE